MPNNLESLIRIQVVGKMSDEQLQGLRGNYQEATGEEVFIC
jgi:hypothetical protein